MRHKPDWSTEVQEWTSHGLRVTVDGTYPRDAAMLTALLRGMLRLPPERLAVSPDRIVLVLPDHRDDYREIVADAVTRSSILAAIGA